MTLSYAREPVRLTIRIASKPSRSQWGEKVFYMVGIYIFFCMDVQIRSEREQVTSQNSSISLAW